MDPSAGRGFDDLPTYHEVGCRWFSWLGSGHSQKDQLQKGEVKYSKVIKITKCAAADYRNQQ